MGRQAVRPWGNSRHHNMKMTSSLGVAALLLSLGMPKYVESVCDISLTLNARTDGREVRYGEGERLVTTCLPGHATHSGQTEFTRTCSGGAWTPTLQCNPVTCSGLPQVEGADVLFLSSEEVVDNQYPVLTTALVICPTGTSTERGRIRYLSMCSYSSTWDDTSPCSVTLDQDMVYAEYNIQLAVTSVQFTPALTDPASTQAQELADSLARALFPVFEEEFGASYIGSRDFVFSQSGLGVAFDFTLLFLPSVLTDLETLRLRIVSALNRANYEQTDPNTGMAFTFERDSLDVSQEPINPFTHAATIGLSIAGAVVAILLFTLIVLFCCCRQNNKPFSVFKSIAKPGYSGFNGARPAMPSTAQTVPTPAIMSPYTQLSDVPYGLPRIP